MTKKHTPAPDFFERFHASQMRLYVLPGVLGVLLAFGAVSLSHTGDMRGLMANVAQVAVPRYGADLVLERTDAGVNIILGKDAQTVDTIEFRLLSDPADHLVLGADGGTLTPEAEGMTHYVRTFGHTDLRAGTIVARLTGVRKETPIALTDAEFVSGTSRYSLTSKGE